MKNRNVDHIIALINSKFDVVYKGSVAYYINGIRLSREMTDIDILITKKDVLNLVELLSENMHPLNVEFLHINENFQKLVINKGNKVYCKIDLFITENIMKTPFIVKAVHKSLNKTYNDQEVFTYSLEKNLVDKYFALFTYRFNLMNKPESEYKKTVNDICDIANIFLADDIYMLIIKDKLIKDKEFQSKYFNTYINYTMLANKNDFKLNDYEIKLANISSEIIDDVQKIYNYFEQIVKQNV